MGVPDLGVLYDDPIVELEIWARELGLVFFDLLRILQPLLLVSSKLRVCGLLIVFGGWSSCPLAPPKQPLRWAQLVSNSRSVSMP